MVELIAVDLKELIVITMAIMLATLSLFIAGFFGVLHLANKSDGQSKKEMLSAAILAFVIREGTGDAVRYENVHVAFDGTTWWRRWKIQRAVDTLVQRKFLHLLPPDPLENDLAGYWRTADFRRLQPTVIGFRYNLKQAA